MSRERQLYASLLEAIQPDLPGLQLCAKALAELDTLNTLAERAIKLDFRCPELVEEDVLEIESGRHPVIESVLEEPFVTNDCLLDQDRLMLIITGPNMGGKSTFMRQTALIVILAYIGSYIPASKARIGPIDRIFTRIGAADDLAGGRSTFMVEMTETANILHNATHQSLVLMDEIGRGTSTFDGLSLAWACAAQLAGRIRAKTLFATHYFELTALPEQFQCVENVHLDAVEHGQEIVFMHRVKPGAANQSYGLQVAALAGIPDEVIQAASTRLQELEEQSVTDTANRVHDPQIPLFQEVYSDPVIDRILKLDLDSLTPRHALETLYTMRKQLKDRQDHESS